MNKKEAPIVEIGGRMMNYKIPKKYLSNSNNVIAAKDKENNNSISNNTKDLLLINKGETNPLKEVSYRIKTGKPQNSIKSIINRTFGGNNNTIIFSNMANDFNNKFLKGIEKKSMNGNAVNKKTK